MIIAEFALVLQKGEDMLTPIILSTVINLIILHYLK